MSAGKDFPSSSRKSRESEISRRRVASQIGRQDTDLDDLSSDDFESTIDSSNSNKDVGDNERLPDFNDWAIVHKPDSKFHGHPCQMKSLIDSESRRAIVYVFSDGKYEFHPFVRVKYKQCRIMTEEEISLLRSNLGKLVSLEPTAMI
jgi:hypothetical protein